LDPSDSREVATEPGAPGAQNHSVSVRCWGTRGSVPTPGPETARFGGNTSCVEVRTGDTRIILDAGTGIRLLGEEIREEEGEKQAVVFLTHSHWDHIQGLPFFSPAYDPDFKLRICGPTQENLSAEAVFAHQMGPIFFPVTFQELPASITFSEVQEGDWVQDGVRMRAKRVRHPSVTLGYRLEALGRSVVYIPDNELEGGSLATPARWGEEIEDFVRGADVLIHDAMFTEEESPSYEGWGHSTFEQTVDLALRADVRRLLFFHHAPGRSDAELNRIQESFEEEVLDRGGDLQVRAAEEGINILL
jgi:phosphoribosyl 1,2-cyclic phosphodiesterase